MEGDAQQLDALRARYLADQVATATPGQRLLMLFERLLRDLSNADAAFAAGDYYAINKSLVHAQEIVLALRDPLDRETDLGRALSSVYNFCFDRLVDANLRKDPEWIARCRQMIEQIATANRVALEATMAAERRPEVSSVG